MKNLTRQNPEQLFVAQELINKVKSKCCGIKDYKYLCEMAEVMYQLAFIQIMLKNISKDFNLKSDTRVW